MPDNWQIGAVCGSLIWLSVWTFILGPGPFDDVPVTLEFRLVRVWFYVAFVPTVVTLIVVALF